MLFQANTNKSSQILQGKLMKTSMLGGRPMQWKDAGGDGCGSGCWKHFLRVLWNVSNWHNVKNAKSYVTFNTIRLFVLRPEKGNFFTYFASEIVVKFWIYTCVALTSQKVNEMKRFTTDSVNWFLRLWGDFEASAGFLFHCQIYYFLVKYPKVWSICFALQQVTYLLTIIINWLIWTT